MPPPDALHKGSSWFILPQLRSAKSRVKHGHRPYSTAPPNPKKRIPANEACATIRQHSRESVQQMMQDSTVLTHKRTEGVLRCFTLNISCELKQTHMSSSKLQFLTPTDSHHSCR
jgi:hypothetical protein